MDHTMQVRGALRPGGLVPHAAARAGRRGARGEANAVVAGGWKMLSVVGGADEAGRVARAAELFHARHMHANEHKLRVLDGAGHAYDGGAMAQVAASINQASTTGSRARGGSPATTRRSGRGRRRRRRCRAPAPRVGRGRRRGTRSACSESASSSLITTHHLQLEIHNRTIIKAFNET